MIPTFKLTIVANNQAGEWAWDAKISAIKAFYAPVCTLDVSVVKTSLKPVLTLLEPNIYQIDPDWYHKVIIPIDGGADIIMFVVPPSDHTQVTVMGIETGTYLGIWQTTVFSDEGSHTYVNQIDQGEAFTVYALHELSHVFYAILKKVDNTHKFFYSGNPTGILPELNFSETVSLYKTLLLALKRLYNALKPSIPTMSRLIEFCSYIEKYEGANLANNNPLDFRYFYGGYLPKYGIVKESPGGFAMFETYELGWEYGTTAVRQMVNNHPAWTFYDFFDRFAPSSDHNDPKKYAEAIAAEMKVDASANLKSTLKI